MFAVDLSTMQYYKLFLLILSVVIAESALTLDDLEKGRMAMQKCENEGNGVDPSLFTQVLDGQMVNDHDFDCFVGCMLEEIHFLNEDGSFNVNKALEKVPENSPNRDMIVDAIKSCGDLKGNDKCSTAHMLYQCAMEKNIPTLLLGS